MKILIATNHSYMLYQFRKELICELQKYGEIVISTPVVGREDELKAMGCRLIKTELNRRSLNPMKDFKLFYFYKKILQTEKPDFVITYSIKPNIYAGIACQRLKIPYYTNVQGLGTAFQKAPVAVIATILYKFAVKKACTVFFENQENANIFLRNKIVDKSQVCVLNGAGVNIEKFHFCEYPSENTGIHFLFLGRIMKEKGVDELFAAARCLKHKYADKIFFDVVGFFEDEYRDIVENLQDEGIITYHGFQSDPVPYYNATHCVILPSYHEGMSNVLLEAASTGRAIITTDISGCREAVEDSVTGFLCERKNVANLIECLEQFIRLDETKRRLMGVAGRQKILREFEKSKVVAKTLDHIVFLRTATGNVSARN